MDNRVISDIARKHGPRLMMQAIDLMLADPQVQADVAAQGQKPAKPSLIRRMANFALIRVATKSVPGAIVVTGGLVAKTLYDHHKARQLPGNPRRLRK